MLFLYCSDVAHPAPLLKYRNDENLYICKAESQQVVYFACREHLTMSRKVFFWGGLLFLFCFVPGGWNVLLGTANPLVHR